MVITMPLDGYEGLRPHQKQAVALTLARRYLHLLAYAGAEGDYQFLAQALRDHLRGGGLTLPEGFDANRVRLCESLLAARLASAEAGLELGKAALLTAAQGATEAAALALDRLLQGREQRLGRIVSCLNRGVRAEAAARFLFEADALANALVLPTSDRERLLGNKAAGEWQSAEAVALAREIGRAEMEAAAALMRFVNETLEAQ